MTTQEIEMCREVQKTAEAGIKTIEALTDMVQDDALSMQLARQTLRYSELYQEAARELLNAKAEGYRSTVIEDAKRRAEIHYHTLLNTSTAHPCGADYAGEHDWDSGNGKGVEAS